MAENYDFSGWATRNDLKCSDGRTIRHNAFKDNDGTTVPLVWNHQHNEVDNTLGHALLENRDQGVYAYCTFNDTENGRNAKELVKHGDITHLSIYANQLKQIGGDVIHGAIREVSLVLAGANPGAYIETVIAHSEDSDEEAQIFTEERITTEEVQPEEKKEEPAKVEEKPEEKSEAKSEEKPEEKSEEKPGEDLEHSDKEGEKEMAEEKTVKDVVDSMTEEQRNVMYALIGAAAEGKGEENMKHNVFENENSEETLAHADIEAAVADAKRAGSMKESFLQHGIENIDYLFPDAKNLTNEPGFIDIHPKAWVAEVIRGVHHTPFSRVKMQFADITGADARAKGYVKGNVKVEEVISLLKRTINPTTVYKKQKLDRDDVIDITDFDVVAWIKREMRTKLDEELAGAYIFGDGRLASDDDKISEASIIPVAKDTTSDLYAMSVTVTPASGESQGHAFINAAVKGMDKYEGSGNVIAFIRQDKVSDMLLLEDNMGRRLYNNKADLANAMRFSKIVEVPASVIHDNSILGVALDLADYNVGADKGGAINMFDDFDIDYNAQKYLIETRCSGGLTLPHSALVFKAGE